MSLEDAIYRLADAVSALADAYAQDSHVEPGITADLPSGPAYGPPTFDEWLQNFGDVRLSSLTHKKPRKITQCSICGKQGVNSRTHPHH